MKSSLAPLFPRMYAASSPLNLVLIGTSEAPAETAPSAATTHWWTLGAQIATRSPGRTPLAIVARAARSTAEPSSANVMRTGGSTIASRSANACSAFRTSSGIVEI